MKKKLTVKDIFAIKGQRKLTEVYVANEDQAAAAEKAGIDILCNVNNIAAIRAAAPNTFLIGGMLAPEAAQSESAAIRLGQEVLSQGADAVYTGISTDKVKAMTKEFIPVVGHVGMVPYRNTWHGGFKAVGKTATDAKELYDLCLRYDDAGAIAVEMELVPEKVAKHITRNVKMLTMSMGSGQACDVQYLFSCDILGTNTGHIPRHAKVYANLQAEYERLRGLMAEAYNQFQEDVENMRFPEQKHSLNISDDAFKAFLESIKPT